MHKHNAKHWSRYDSRGITKGGMPKQSMTHANAVKAARRAALAAKSDEFAAFVPLSIAPVRAKAEGFDSATSLKRKITLHLSNLYEAKWGGTGMERDSGFSLVPRVIEPIYGFNSTIPLGMRFAKEYPDEWEGFHGWEYPHGNASLYGGFKGIVKFVFDNYTLWDDFRFLMHKSDSGYWTGGTTLSWLAELDFDNAVVEKDWDVRRWDAIQASKSGQ